MLKISSKKDSERVQELLEELFDVKYRTQQDVLSLANIGFNDINNKSADYYRKVIKGKFQEMWMEFCKALEELDLIEPCGCAEHDRCEKCIGRRFKAR
jgi:uncharacterized protein YejL (UPF0352 family)